MKRETGDYGESLFVMYEDIRPLEECESEFLVYLENQTNINKDRNKRWFPQILSDYKKYLYWTVCFFKSRIVAFSAIQSHFFPAGTVRILTRTFFDPTIRLQPGYNLWVETPVAEMAKKQLNWLRGNKDISKALITMESRHRRDYFSKIINKINLRAEADFKILDESMKTYDSQPKHLWHHGAFMDLSLKKEHSGLNST